MSYQKPEVTPGATLSSSRSEHFNLSTNASEDVGIKSGLSRASSHAKTRPASYNALLPSRASSSDVVRELDPSSSTTRLSKRFLNKRPSSLVARLSPTKMLQIGKKRKAEERCAADDDPLKVSPYPFKVDTTRDKGSTQSMNLSGFFPSYSPVLYFGDVGSFDSILQPPVTSSSPKDQDSYGTPPPSGSATPIRSGSSTPTKPDHAYQGSRQGKRAELTRALRKAVKEAKDACRWLNAAGFPQYVQMYEDGQFPIHLTRIQVEKDHLFLEQADIDALIRRLNILNRCADKMDEIRNVRFDDSDEEHHSRALSDKWHFRRRQKKWTRRRESRTKASSSSNQGTPQHETLFSSCEDLLQDNNAASWDAPTNQSPLMLVSELRGSLTGLDRAVKTYSFMLTEDQVPSIQVEGPGATAAGSSNLKSGGAALQEMSSAFSSFESDEENEEYDEDYPSGSMDNFATGMLSAFDSNLLKMKDLTTQSLPDVFKESTGEYPEGGSCDVSPLSSASASTTSIADSIGPVDPPPSSSSLSYPQQSHQQNQHYRYSGYNNKNTRVHHPLAGTFSYDLGSSRRGNYELEEELREGGSDRVQVEKRYIHIPSAEDADRRPGGYSKMNGASHSRMFSGDSLGACSLAGSEYSERDFSGFSSSSPVPSTLTTSSSRFSRVPNGVLSGSAGDQPPHNGREHTASVTGGNTSPFEDLTKRISKTSITSSSDTYKKHISKWHGYQRPHSFRASFKPVRTLIPIEELSVGQISVLRKLCLVKITALIELHRAKTNIAKLLKSKTKKPGEPKPVSQGKKVFGVSLSTNVRQTGQALPPTILHAIEYLSQDNNLETTGLFRRAASKAKMDSLKELMENNPNHSDFSDFSVYDVADAMKMYFRELPDPLLTSKFSELLITLRDSVPTEELRLPALQGIVLLLPDEHREALQVLLGFLKNVAELSETNQMTPQNLAVCFAPTLFSLSNSLKPKTTSSLSRKGSFKRNNIHVTLTPEQVASNKEISESVASSHCLTEMICSADKLFKVAADMLQVCRFTHLEMCDPVPYYELELDRKGSSNMNAYLDSCVQTILREARKKFKHWSHVETVGDVEISCLKVSDGVPLRVWRGVVDIDASNTSVYLGLWSDRSWQFDIASSSYVLVSTSVSHPQATLQGGIRATHLASFFLVEPLDNEHCRLTHLCRVDMRGRSAEYYNKYYGPYLASTLNRVQELLYSKEGMHETSV